jgi:hypothetical protein
MPVVVTLDSLEPSIYVGLGLVLIFGSLLVRRLGFGPKSPVGDRRGGIEIRIQSEKVVPINRGTQVSQQVAFSVSRASLRVEPRRASN